MEKNKLNSRNRKIFAILAAGVAIAIAAAFLAYMYLAPQRTTIYVFADSYKAGETVTSDMLWAVQCDSSIMIEGADMDTSDIFVTHDQLNYVLGTGDTLRMDVSAGMPLTTGMLSVNGGSSIELNMASDKIAVSIPVNETSGVSNDLKEGSYVNIYFTGGDTAGTTLLFQGMRILSISRNSSGTIEAVTVECTTDESLKLVYAENYGSLYLGLIDSSGYQHVEGEPSYAMTGQED